jgi:hypothetical protein
MRVYTVAQYTLLKSPPGKTVCKPQRGTNCCRFTDTSAAVAVAVAQIAISVIEHTGCRLLKAAASASMHPVAPTEALRCS